MNSLAPETQNTAAPKILILGATRPTGRHIVTQQRRRAIRLGGHHAGGVRKCGL